MPHKPLTESDLLQEANVKSLQNIKELNLCDRGLGSIDSTLFNKLCWLHTLYLSNNNLREIPSDFCPRQLETLDLSDNDLSSLQFVTQCPRLQSLYVAGNKKLKVDDVYIAADRCPTLETSDLGVGFSACSLQTGVHSIREKLSYKVKGVWNALFRENVRETNFTDNDRQQLLQNFVDAFEKQKIWDTNSLMKFQRYVVHCLAKEIVNSLGTEAKLEAFKRKPKRSLKTIQEDESDEESPPKRAKHKRTKSIESSTTKTTTSLCSAPKSVRFTKLKSKPLPQTSFTLSAVKDYTPIHFVRCHSYDNDPTDDGTKVWKCAFEPNPENIAETTNIVGSCGGQIVSLLDCRTGKVMKRYKDDAAEESFYCLAWTTVAMPREGSNHPTNLLAVAGEGECIKLLHPDQLLVYAVLHGHKKAVQCLFFHPHQPTHLFSGSDDNRVILWDIGIPDPVTYETKHSRLLSLRTPGSGVLNLVFSGSLHWLLAACEEGCYGWNLRSYTKDIKLPTVEFCLPEMNDDACSVDGLAILPNNIVATKVIEQATIYLWKLHDHVTDKLYKSMKMVSVNALCGLSYPLTDTPYINLNISSGLLVVGDTKGSVMIYNLQKLLKKDTHLEGSYASCSRELKWPLLHGDNKRMMLDSNQEKVVINMAALSSDGRYLVSGTDNNLLCVWHRD